MIQPRPTDSASRRATDWRTLTGALVCVALLSPCLAAQAAPRVGKRAQAAKAKAAVRAAEERRSPADFRWRGRPDDKNLSMSERANRKRDQFIGKLEKLLPSMEEGSAKAEYVFRLSEAYWLKSKHNHLQAMRTWDEELERWANAGHKGREPLLDDVGQAQEAEVDRQKALSLYREIIATYPNYPRLDEVLYNLASSLYESGKKREGVRKYLALVREYPASDYVADAWLELGEHFFAANKLSKAVTAYKKAAETKKPRIFSFALYKLAWCDYNLGAYDEALAKFRRVVEYSRGDASSQEMGQRDRLQLIEEALSDMVRSYSHLDAVDEAFEYYEAQVGAQRSYKYVHRLAQLYNAEGKFALEVRAFDELNKRHPYNPAAAENQAAIMNAYAKADRKDKVRKAVRRLVNLYSPNGTWARRNADTPRVVERAAEVVEQQLAGLVTDQHRAARETKLVSTYRLARDIYSEYLGIFPNSENGIKFRFFYGEILYELKEFQQAAPQYDRVVVERPQGPYAKRSAYNAILAWEKVAAGAQQTLAGSRKIRESRGRKSEGLKQLARLERLTKGGEFRASALSAVEKKLADACDRFAQVAAKDSEVVKVKFKSARLYYIHNQFEEAAKRFGEIIDRWPKDDLARVSADSIVQSFNVRSDWSNLNLWSRKFSGNRQLMADKAFAKRIREFVEGASFNEINHVFEPKSTPAAVATLYAAFVAEFPASAYAMVALYNVIINYDKANELGQAITAANRLLRDYKRFKPPPGGSAADAQALPSAAVLREQVLFLAGSLQQRIAEFSAAATLYEQYVSEFPAGAKVADAAYNAGVFRQGLGQFGPAIKNLRQYTKNRQISDRQEIEWRIGVILEQMKNYGAAATHFAQVARDLRRVNPAQALCAEYKVLRATLAQGKDVRQGYGALLARYGQLSTSVRVLPCPLKAAGEAAFALLQPSFSAYLKIKLAGLNGKRLAKTLERKFEVLGRLQKDYIAVLAIGHGDFGVAALYRIGAAYRDLAGEIFATPCPKQLDQEQCAIYQAELQEMAFPLEEKAIEALDKALAKAFELGLYNEWLIKAQEALKSYEPGRFPEIRTYALATSASILALPRLVELK